MKRKIIKIDEDKCDGCGVCVPACAEGALQIIDGKARLLEETYCDGLGACLGECPQGAITMEEREAEAFDEEEVKLHLKSKKEEVEPLPCGCPSAAAKSWEAGGEETIAKVPSLLSHWPVKLKLVSPGAPYFNRDELLMAADCVPFAHGNFHNNFLEDKALITGCPKFDEMEYYLEKLTEILKSSQIKTITVARMEVPCCSGWLALAKRAVKASGKEIEVEEKVIGIQGEIVN